MSKKTAKLKANPEVKTTEAFDWTTDRHLFSVLV
jgi:hypothetical protein